MYELCTSYFDGLAGPQYWKPEAKKFTNIHTKYIQCLYRLKVRHRNFVALHTTIN